MCQLPTRSPRESDNVSPTRFMLPLNNSRSSSVNDKEKDSARSSRRKLDTLTFDEALDDEHAWSSKDIGRNTISVHPTLIKGLLNEPPIQEMFSQFLQASKGLKESIQVYIQLNKPTNSL
jgi:hypothetical protein